ncbi:MAG: A/G-specific adenine glycosylase, partial [Sphingobacteriales bacterium]
MVKQETNKRINVALLTWFSANKRPLPWRQTKNPYHIWLSEIILQQTRVAQGTPYYQRFIENYPTVEHLAAADEQEVLKLWQGLGYYSRARNLHATAKMIAEKYKGIFPDDVKEILSLKGIGDYTAAAIISIAFNKPFAVLDGNVFRVLSRLFLIETPINAPEAKKIFQTKAQELLDKDNPGEFN